MGDSLPDSLEAASFTEQQQILKSGKLLKISQIHCFPQAGPSSCMDLLRYYSSNLQQLPAQAGVLEESDRLDSFYEAVEEAPFSLNPEMLIFRHYV